MPSDSVGALLAPWSTFFVAISTSAAALIGLTFVVITIVMGNQRRQTTSDGLATFTTPTVMYFSAAMFVSILLLAPWRSTPGFGLLVGIIGAFGVAYTVRVIVHARRFDEYTPDLEDWTYYTVLPLIAYGTLLLGAILFVRATALGIDVLAVSVILLTFIGIRNAWDVVTYIAISRPAQLAEEEVERSK